MTLPPFERPTPPLGPPGRVEGVPEPSSWLMLGLGLVLAGLAARARSKGGD